MSSIEYRTVTELEEGDMIDMSQFYETHDLTDECDALVAESEYGWVANVEPLSESGSMYLVGFYNLGTQSVHADTVFPYYGKEGEK